MALSIKTDEADALARALAEETNESLTQAVTTALRERLDRVRGAQTPTIESRLAALAQEYATLPVVDPRAPEDVIGFDADGAPA